MTASTNSPDVQKQIALLDEKWKKQERHQKIYGASEEKFKSILKISGLWLLLIIANTFISTIPVMKFINIGFIVLCVSALGYHYLKLKKFAKEETEYQNARKELLTKISK